MTFVRNALFFKSTNMLERLTIEVMEFIIKYLTRSDIETLKMTSKTMKAAIKTSFYESTLKTASTDDLYDKYYVKAKEYQAFDYLAHEFELKFNCEDDSPAKLFSNEFYTVNFNLKKTGFSANGIAARINWEFKKLEVFY